MVGDMPASLYGSDSGQSAIKNLLLLSPMMQLGGLPTNFTLTEPTSEFGSWREVLRGWLGSGCAGLASRLEAPSSPSLPALTTNLHAPSPPPPPPQPWRSASSI